MAPSRVVFVSLLCLFVTFSSVSAQSMPSFPMAYVTDYSSSSTLQPGVVTKGHLSVDFTRSDGNWTRSDVATTSYSFESISELTATTMQSWTIMTIGGKPQPCQHSSTPYVPPAGNNCTAPAYQGTAVVGGITCMYWEIVCPVAPAGNTTEDIYFNGNTPVQVVAQGTSGTTPYTSTQLYTNFVAGPVDPSVFVPPSSCPTHLNKPRSKMIASRIKEIVNANPAPFLGHF